jgi:hypothetical protein
MTRSNDDSSNPRVQSVRGSSTRDGDSPPSGNGFQEKGADVNRLSQNAAGSGALIDPPQPAKPPPPRAPRFRWAPPEPRRRARLSPLAPRARLRSTVAARAPLITLGARGLEPLTSAACRLKLDQRHIGTSISSNRTTAAVHGHER